MAETKPTNENRIRKLFTLRPDDIQHLNKLARANGGNKSQTIQQLIEDAWKEQSAKEQR